MHALAGIRERLGDRVASFRATTAIMPRPQLKVRSMSSVGTRPTSRSQRNTPAPATAGIEARAHAVGQAARHVAGQAAAGDVGQALDRAGGADRRQQRLDVDARRFEQRLTQRSRGERSGGVVAEAAALHDAAHQRIAVGMRAARCQPQHHVARRDVAARQQPVAFGGADREAGEVVVALGIHAGHLRRLAADQGAAGAPAAFGDAGDDATSGVDIEPAAGIVVEEEQRLGALDHDVVDAHRHQVDADRVGNARLDRDLELGADAVGARDEDRDP